MTIRRGMGVGVPKKGRRSDQPGPIYDGAMKILVDDDLDAVLFAGRGVRWGAADEHRLPGSQMWAIWRVPGVGIVHVEFVKDRSPDLDLRMMAYRLRMRRQYDDRNTPIAQYVLVLGDKITVPDRYIDVDAEPSMFRWSVFRLAELDTGLLLGNSTTAAVAALGRGSRDERAGSSSPRRS